MLMEPDWLNTLVAEVETKLHYSSWPSMILKPHT